MVLRCRYPCLPSPLMPTSVTVVSPSRPNTSAVAKARAELYCVHMYMVSRLPHSSTHTYTHAPANKVSQFFGTKKKENKILSEERINWWNSNLANELSKVKVQLFQFCLNLFSSPLLFQLIIIITYFALNKSRKTSSTNQ